MAFQMRQGDWKKAYFHIMTFFNHHTTLTFTHANLNFVVEILTTRFLFRKENDFSEPCNEKCEPHFTHITLNWLESTNLIRFIFVYWQLIPCCLRISPIFNLHMLIINRFYFLQVLDSTWKLLLLIIPVLQMQMWFLVVVNFIWELLKTSALFLMSE